MSDDVYAKYLAKGLQGQFQIEKDQNPNPSRICGILENWAVLYGLYAVIIYSSMVEPGATGLLFKVSFPSTINRSRGLP